MVVYFGCLRAVLKVQDAKSWYALLCKIISREVRYHSGDSDSGPTVLKPEIRPLGKFFGILFAAVFWGCLLLFFFKLFLVAQICYLRGTTGTFRESSFTSGKVMDAGKVTGEAVSEGENRED